MAVRGPKAQALAAEVADADVELALLVPVIGDTVAPFMAPVPDTGTPAATGELGGRSRV
jgi:hypothetical protein